MSENSTNAHEFTVSQISAAVKNLLEEEFAYIRVRGEVGRISRPSSGHIYFDLKDEKAVISAVAWRGVSSRWKFQPEEGLEVIITGRLTTFAGQSKYQIIVDLVEPAGVGALMALLEERRKKLAKEGLFSPEHKKTLPFLPKLIGVITSPTGAVIRDILHRLEDRFPTNVIIWPVRVQGENCAKEVTNAIYGFNSLKSDGKIARPDLIIIARGGGSLEDLWGFNEEEVVRAVFASEIPIISAIGHETDTTLIDYVADKRAPTPTGAAEIAVPVRSELLGLVEDLSARLKGAILRLIMNRGDKLRAISAHLPRKSDLLSFARQKLDLLDEKLSNSLIATKAQKSLMLAKIAPKLSLSAIRQRNKDWAKNIKYLGDRALVSIKRLIVEKKNKLDKYAKLLQSLSYNSILKRGFSLVIDEKGKIIARAANININDNLNIKFYDGNILAIAKTKSAKLAAKAKEKNKKSSKSDNKQTSLF